jgi:hypothetical protein
VVKLIVQDHILLREIIIVKEFCMDEIYIFCLMNFSIFNIIYIVKLKPELPFTKISPSNEYFTIC